MKQVAEFVVAKTKCMAEIGGDYLRMSENIQIFQLYPMLSDDNKSYLMISEEIWDIEDRKDSKDGRD